MKHGRMCVWKRISHGRSILKQPVNQLTQGKDNSLENDIITFSLLKAKEKLTQRLKRETKKKTSAERERTQKKK